MEILSNTISATQAIERRAQTLIFRLFDDKMSPVEVCVLSIRIKILLIKTHMFESDFNVTFNAEAAARAILVVS